MIGVCEFGAEEGGMKPALELTGWDPVNEVQMTAGEAPPQSVPQTRNSEPGNVYQLFLSSFSPSPLSPSLNLPASARARSLILPLLLLGLNAFLTLLLGLSLDLVALAAE